MNTPQNITSTYTILLVVFISLIIITILIIKQKKEKRELKLLLDVATELKKNNKLNCSILEEKEKQIEALFKNQYKYINDLANNYYSYNSSPSASKIIYSYVKETLEKITKEEPIKEPKEEVKPKKEEPKKEPVSSEKQEKKPQKPVDKYEYVI